MAQGATIIIPTYNRAPLLRSALESVQRMRLPEGWTAEVLVVENNCTDDTAAVCEQSFRDGPLPVRRVVESKQGLNHGRNRGIQEARFEHLVYLDDDMVVDPGWLEGYAEVIERFSPHAVMGPVDPMYEEAPAAWMTRRMIESVSSAYSQKGSEAVVVPREHAHELPGCNFAVRRDVALAVGGFHPALDRCGSGMLAGGDWEFGEQLVLSNRKVAYSPKCRIRHLVSRHKMSRDGLRARWEGSGATIAANMRLRRQVLPIPRRLHLALRMVRLLLRSYRLRIAGDDAAAFRWELESLLLKGMLAEVPAALEPRRAKDGVLGEVPDER